MGLRTADRYPPLFLQAVGSASRGAVVGPFRSGAGFHILLVLDKRNANLPEPFVTQTRARHILMIPTAQRNAEATAAQLNRIRSQIAGGQVSFEDAARQFSQDGSAAGGGDLGWANPGQFVPEFEAVMDDLNIGDLSAPTPSRFGVHLIQVVERREVEITDAQRRDWVRNVLREQKEEEAYEEWARDLRARAFVEYRDN
jgi:peptidyl-prolyl cis-trans isomerase SurA